MDVFLDRVTAMRPRVPQAQLLRPLVLRGRCAGDGPAHGRSGAVWPRVRRTAGRQYMDIPPLAAAVVPVIKALSSLA
jgi:hypothetical protein